MKNKIKESYVEGVLVLILFCIFAVCILAVLLTGAGAYQRLMLRGQNAYTERTVPQYIATKIRQADVSGMISVSRFGDTQALELAEEIAGERYITRIYYYEGYIMELYTMQEGEFEPTDGERIMEADGINFSFDNQCITVCIKHKNGTMTEQKLTLRSTEGGN